MPPSPGSPSGRKEPQSPDTIPEQTIHDLLVPLTIIKAQAQMLGRWAQRSGVPDSEVVLAKLTVIDAMVIRVVEELQSHQESPSDTTTDSS